MLMRTDPFRDLHRLTEAVLGSRSHPAVMPMDAWRDDDRFVIEFDLPGVARDSVDLDRIEASYSDGVLRLVVPVAEKAGPRKIEISGRTDAEELNA